MSGRKPVLQPLAVAGAAFSGSLLVATFCGYRLLAGMVLGVAFLCIVAAALALLGRLWSRTAVLALFFAATAVGVSLAGRAALLRTAGRWAGETATFIGRIETVQAGSTAGYLLRVQSGDLEPGIRVLIYSGTSPEFSKGESIWLTVELNSEPPTRSQLGKGADLTGYAAPDSIRLAAPASGCADWVGRLREELRGRLYRTLGTDAAGFFEAVLLGDADALSPSVREVFSATGTAHLLCISGLHISLLMGIAGWIFRRLLGCGKTAFLLTGLAGGAFVLLTGAAPSAVRAWIMAVFALSANAFYRDYSPGNALGGAVLVLCLQNPRVVFQNGFWLSVLATAAMFAVAPCWTRKVRGQLPRRVAGNPLVKGAVSLVCGTLAANVCCLPVFFLWSGSVPALAPLANLLLVPIFPFLVAGGGICLLGSWTDPLGNLLSRVLEWIFALLERLAKVPHSVLPLGLPWIWIWAGFALLLFGTARFLGKRRRLGLAAALSAVLFVAGAASGVLARRNALAVAAVSTENGGSLVLELGGRAILIGCGGDSQIGGKTASYLWSTGVFSLDAVLIPEESRRCMSGVSNLARRFPIKSLFSDSASNWYQTALDSPDIGQCLPLAVGEYRLFGRYPLETARVDGWTRIAVSAYGRRLLFLSKDDPRAEEVSVGADLVFFYDEIPQKDGISSPEYAIIKDKQSWLDGFSEIGKNYAAGSSWVILPSGGVRSWGA